MLYKESITTPWHRYPDEVPEHGRPVFFKNPAEPTITEINTAGYEHDLSEGSLWAYPDEIRTYILPADMTIWIPIQEKLPDENREFYYETDPACMDDNPDEEHAVYKVVGGRLLYRFGKKPWQDAGPFDGYATTAQGKWSYAQPSACKAPKRMPFSKWRALAKPDLYKALQKEYNEQEN